MHLRSDGPTLSMSGFKTVRTSEERWRDRWLEIAKVVSTWSKDPSTQVGAVLVRDNLELSKGYNGFPSRIPDREAFLHDRDTKYKYTIHAEMNALNNAAKHGISTAKSTIYIYGLPCCHRCVLPLINAGVERFVMQVSGDMSRWEASWGISREILSTANMGDKWELLDRDGNWTHGSLQHTTGVV